MPVSRNILGMNARNFLYIRRYNFKSAKQRADDKLATKRLLLKQNIPTPKLYATFENRSEILSYQWDLPERGFVIKPARGYGGAGILPFKKWDGETGRSIVGETYSKHQLESHLIDILDGAYSLQYLPDKAFIEERIMPHPFFKKIDAVGVPDIRVIVFNHIPVMAMLRLPTEKSGGKANLHSGAIAFGIDLRTGITTYAIAEDKIIRRIPNTKIKTSGIKIPDWDAILHLAATAQAVSKLGYAGIDIVLDGRYGPQVLEINARPGLSIQIANLTSLRTRLERLEHMPIPTPARGVEVAKSLFAEEFSERVQTAPKVLTVTEPVTLRYKDTEVTIPAKLDTGAYRTSFDRKLIKKLGIPISDEKVYVQSASGTGYRHTANVTFVLGGKKITTIASITDRSRLRYPVIVGRKDLKGFLIKPEMEYEEEDIVVKKEEAAFN